MPEQSDVIRCGTTQEWLPRLDDGSVDLVLADLPYGKTRNKWDEPFDLSWLWVELYRIAKLSAAMVFFAQGTFAIDLIISNRKDYRYDLVWEKDRTSGFLNAKRMPMRSHEYLLVFYRRQPVYNPQMVYSEKAIHSRGKRGQGTVEHKGNYGKYLGMESTEEGLHQRHPRSVLKFARPHPMIHPTQKPVDLCEWIIKSYTHEGDVVLDPCFGSGSALLAARGLGRRFVGIERNPQYVEMAQRRLSDSAKTVEAVTLGPDR